tara:strand:- start:276 stop:641 length:366 start_codon:yes stop_codon:yes gene_type:complete
MTFKYSPSWQYHPIVIDGKTYSFDPKLNVPVPPDHEDFGKTVQDIVGADKITNELYDEYKEKETWEQMRTYRNALLVESDWTQGADVPDAIKGPWATYRQSLRDITKVTTTDKVVWPTKPS